MMPLWSRIAANKSVQTVTHGDAADATCGFGAGDGDCVATGAGGGAAGDGAAICGWATGGSAGGGGDGAGGNHTGAAGAA